MSQRTIATGQRCDHFMSLSDARGIIMQRIEPTVALSVVALVAPVLLWSFCGGRCKRSLPTNSEVQKHRCKWRDEAVKMPIDSAKNLIYSPAVMAIGRSAGRVGTSAGTCKQDARFNDEVIGLEGPHVLVRSLGFRPRLPQQKISKVCRAAQAARAIGATTRATNNATTTQGARHMAQITGNSGAPTRPSSLPRWPQGLRRTTATSW